MVHCDIKERRLNAAGSGNRQGYLGSVKMMKWRTSGATPYCIHLMSVRLRRLPWWSFMLMAR